MFLNKFRASCSVLQITVVHFHVLHSLAANLNVWSLVFVRSPQVEQFAQATYFRFSQSYIVDSFLTFFPTTKVLSKLLELGSDNHFGTLIFQKYLHGLPVQNYFPDHILTMVFRKQCAICAKTNIWGLPQNHCFVKIVNI